MQLHRHGEALEIGDLQYCSWGPFVMVTLVQGMLGVADTKGVHPSYQQPVA